MSEDNSLHEIRTVEGKIHILTDYEMQELISREFLSDWHENRSIHHVLIGEHFTLTDCLEIAMGRCCLNHRINPLSDYKCLKMYHLESCTDIFLNRTEEIIDGRIEFEELIGQVLHADESNLEQLTVNRLIDTESEDYKSRVYELNKLQHELLTDLEINSCSWKLEKILENTNLKGGQFKVQKKFENK